MRTTRWRSAFRAVSSAPPLRRRGSRALEAARPDSADPAWPPLPFHTALCELSWDRPGFDGEMLSSPCGLRRWDSSRNRRFAGGRSASRRDTEPPCPGHEVRDPPGPRGAPGRGGRRPCNLPCRVAPFPRPTRGSRERRGRGHYGASRGSCLQKPPQVPRLEAADPTRRARKTQGCQKSEVCAESLISVGKCYRNNSAFATLGWKPNSLQSSRIIFLSLINKDDEKRCHSSLFLR